MKKYHIELSLEKVSWSGKGRMFCEVYGVFASIDGRGPVTLFLTNDHGLASHLFDVADRLLREGGPLDLEMVKEALDEAAELAQKCF